MNEPPNWVKLRAECHLDIAFEGICSVVRRDVKEANKLPADKRKGGTFRIQDCGSTSLHVIREGCPDDADEREGREPPRIIFRQDAKEISISRSASLASLKPTRLFHVIVQWNPDNSRCDLMVDGRQVEPWQVSQKALAGLFFG